MPINFYFMNGCGYCVKSKKLLSGEISSGDVVIIDSSKAPAGVSGFPYFEYKGTTHTGYPGTKDKLFSKLGYSKENYSGYRENYQQYRENYSEYNISPEAIGIL